MATTSANVANSESTQPFIPPKAPSKTKATFTVNLFEENTADGSKKIKPKWLILGLFLLFLLLLIIGLVVFLYLLPGCNSKKLSNEWWKKEVIYQVEVSMFKDSNSDGIGDIKGLTQKLDYINKLGAKTIILSRLNSKETVKSIDPIYGDADSLVELRKELDKRGMHIIIDLPLDYLEKDDKEIVEYWLNNYADGIRVTNLNDASNVYSSVKIENLAFIVREVQPKNSKFFGTDSEEVFTGTQLRTHKFFLELDPESLGDTAFMTNALNRAYESDKTIWPSFMLGDFTSKRIRSLYASNLFKLVHGLVLLVRGTPVVLYGDEIELQGNNELENTMQFENTIGCGFTDSEDVGEYFQKSTSNCQNAALTDLRKMYEDLIKLREDPAFSTGDIIMLKSAGGLAFIRKANGKEGNKYLVVVNTEDKLANLDLRGELQKKGEHETQGSVVYSYSVYSIKREVNSVIEVSDIRVKQGEILVLKLGHFKGSDDDLN